MGLSVHVGYLAMLHSDEEGREDFLDQLGRINALLRENGLAEHVEKDTFDGDLLPHGGSMAYSTIHYLRRAAAHTRERAKPPPFQPLPPDQEIGDPMDDPLIDNELTVYMDSHLICHSDCEGYYVPQDFKHVLYGDVRGDMLGSSHRLLAELQRTAPLLGIPLENGEMSEATARDLMRTPADHPLRRERFAFGMLYANALASVRYGTLVVFS